MTFLFYYEFLTENIFKIKIICISLYLEWHLKYCSLCRYVGLCAGIKILALALFLVDWWLVRRRKHLEEAGAILNVNDLVANGSIISLDKCKWFKEYLLDSLTFGWAVCVKPTPLISFFVSLSRIIESYRQWKWVQKLG